MFKMNPSFPSENQLPMGTPNQSFSNGITPLVSSTPFSGIGKNGTQTEFTENASKVITETLLPVDMIIENPIFGSGLTLRKVCR